MITKRQLSRREFIRLTAAIAALPLTLPLSDYVKAAEADESYEAAVAKIWRPMNATITEPIAGRAADQLLLKRELVRYATLAASSHNTQCWKFKIAANGIVILPDFSRRCPAVDPDNHHLFVSLGAATENLVQAALANGLQAEVNFNADAAQAIDIALSPT